MFQNTDMQSEQKQSTNHKDKLSVPIIYIFFILFHEVIRDIFILSKIINTIFNYITDNLKNMGYEKNNK